MWDQELWKHETFGFIDNDTATNGVRAVMAVPASNQGAQGSSEIRYVASHYPVLSNLPAGASSSQMSPATRNVFNHDHKWCSRCQRTINRDVNGAINILNHWLWKMSRFIYTSSKQEKKKLSVNWHRTEARHPGYFMRSNKPSWLPKPKHFNLTTTTSTTTY